LVAATATCIIIVTIVEIHRLIIEVCFYINSMESVVIRKKFIKHFGL